MGCPSYENLFSMNDASWQILGVEEKFPMLVQREYILALMHPCVTGEEQSLIRLSWRRRTHPERST